MITEFSLISINLQGYFFIQPYCVANKYNFY